MAAMNADALKMNIQTFEPFCSPTPADPKDWPYRQKYMGTCLTCDSRFSGPKHAWVCWECLGEAHQKQWLDAYQI